MMCPLFRFSLLIVLLPSTFWTDANAVRSSTLLLARSDQLVSPNAGSPLAAWAASIAAQSAADAAGVATLAAKPKPKPKGHSRHTFVPIAAGRQILRTPSYVARARLGTPPQTLLVAIDPSNDAAWVPCSACLGCAPGASSPSFDPTQSSTYRPVRCGAPQCAQVPPATPSCPAGPGASCAFNLSYASSTLHAVLGQDALSLSDSNGAAVPDDHYTFGCLRVVTGSGGSVPPQGLVGFGRGPLSFLSQTKATYGSIFSYCLPSYKSSNFSGTLRLGPAGQPRRIKTTPLLSNPHRPSLYYVAMVGVRVNGKAVPIPASVLALDAATGRGGTIVDAGTMFTRLSPPAYAALRNAFRRGVSAPAAPALGGFDTCYYVNGTKSVPAVAFVFAGGARVTLPEENVVISSTSGGVACLAMAAGPSDGVNAGLNVLASMQQQNHRVVFDVGNGRVGFSRELCTAV